MLLDYELFEAFESDEDQWPYSVLNIVNICDRISQEGNCEEIPSLPREYLRSLYKVARCYELEGKFETLGSGGAMDHGLKIKPALPYIKDVEHLVPIQKYQFSLEDFEGELKSLFDSLIEKLPLYGKEDVVCIEYYLHSNLLFSRSTVTVYSISAIRDHAVYLTEKAKVNESKGRLNSARRCLEVAKELKTVSAGAVLQENTHLAYGKHFDVSEAHGSINHVWPIDGSDDLWPVSSNESAINKAVFSLIEGYKSKIFGSWCNSKFEFRVSGYNEFQEILP